MLKLSIILPTLNKSTHIVSFLKSLSSMNKVRAEIEVIVIDQNESEKIKQICMQFSRSNNYNLIYRKSNVRGISVNRNIAIKIATGNLLAFPDDDCIYYPNTIEKVLNYYSNPNYKKYDAFIGQIIDRNNKKKIIKSWPKFETNVTLFNFYNLSSSITLFCKRNNIEFNDMMGVGSSFGSCEDVEYIYQMLKDDKKIRYLPDIQVFHPELDTNNISLARVESYASGLGYFIIHNISIIKLCLLFGCFIQKGKQFLFPSVNYPTGYFKAYFKGLFRGLNWVTNK